jgi:hypothetical protein
VATPDGAEAIDVRLTVDTDAMERDSQETTLVDTEPDQ